MWGVAIGVALMLSGVVLISLGSQSLDAGATRRLELVRASLFVDDVSTPQFSQFLNSSTWGTAMSREPVYLSFYLWNLTNGPAVLRGLESPQAEQIGPYTYEKTARKIDVKVTPSPTDGQSRLVSYRIASTYRFVPARSNGSEQDVVVTLNATYVRHLTKLRAAGYSERFLVAEFAQQHLQQYNQHLRGPFLASTKIRGLQFYFPTMLDAVRDESVPAAIRRQRDRVDSASISKQLVKMYAVARTESVPRVLHDVYKDVSDRFLPDILREKFERAKRDALPRVLMNLYKRLRVEAVPALLQRQLNVQLLRHVPQVLSSINYHLPSIAFPYAMQEVYDRACVNAVPFVLRSIKLEIIARNIAQNQVQADVAQNSVIETWRKRMGAGTTGIDFDAWIDDNPTGKPRTGFELKPASASLELSHDVAAMLLGSKASNKRFSVVDFDVSRYSTYPLEAPTDTPEGFAIWREVIAMNETAIDYVISSVNYDIALPADFITRSQVLAVRDYLIKWAQSDVVRRDRERLWRQGFTKRTINTDITEPTVDMDVEELGVQPGFTLHSTGQASASGVTAAIAQQLWKSTDPFSFTNVQGFTLWSKATKDGDANAQQQLLSGVSGLTLAQLNEIGSWISRLQADGFISRRARRHWIDGTCLSALKLKLDSCVIYDLEPSIAGIQDGFEVNPTGLATINIPNNLRDDMWSSAKSVSFLQRVPVYNVTSGFGVWQRSIRAGDPTPVITAIQGMNPSWSISKTTATAISRWLSNWSRSYMNLLALQWWWVSSTCLPRKVVSTSNIISSLTAGQVNCAASYQEAEQSAQVTVAAASRSPYTTTQRSFRVTQVDCNWDVGTSTYTRNSSTFDLVVLDFSCETLPTELSDDADPDSIVDNVGFELTPKVADSSLQLSLAAANLIWDASKPFSFLNPTGYKQWLRDYSTNSSLRAQMMQSINNQVASLCSTLRVGGERSAVWNLTVIGTPAACSAVTTDQMDAIARWVGNHAASEWVRRALLDQWRRGGLDDTDAYVAGSQDIEPYRSGKQVGWELSQGCSCSLTSAGGLVYQIPRSSMDLWDATNNASFLAPSGFELWSKLINATEFNDTTAMALLQTTIVQAFGRSLWIPWMDRVRQWLRQWLENEHLLRDVLSHWLYASCDTSPAAITVISSPSPLTATVPSCSMQSRYTISLNTTLSGIQMTASRPEVEMYFDEAIVEKTATVQAAIGAEVNETWITCEMQGNVATETTSTRISTRMQPSCNLLQVLSSGCNLFEPLEATFEMNRSRSDVQAHTIPVGVALAVWNVSGQWGLTNTSVFLEKWQPATRSQAKLRELELSLFSDAGYPNPAAGILSDVIAYIVKWQASSESARRVASAWLQSGGVYLDLDVTASGLQTGFELYPTLGWRDAVGASAAQLPTLDTAQYLWQQDKTFSFLNTKRGVTPIPTGYWAWREIVDGLDPSSERLVEEYPLVAKTTKDAAMLSRSLGQVDRDVLIQQMKNATSLSENQLRGIARWLTAWADNRVLREDILSVWATGVSRRGDEVGVQFDFANSQQFKKLGMKTASGPDLFSVDAAQSATSQLLSSISRSTLRSLWDVSTAGSLVNPETQVVWCMVEFDGGICANLLDAWGAVNASSWRQFKDVTEPTLDTVGLVVTATSDFATLALKYLELKFGLSTSQTKVLAHWWRSIPTRSVYYRALQLKDWSSIEGTKLSSVIRNPDQLGYSVAMVFPRDAVISRAATFTDLQVNPALLPTCNVSQNLGLLLWNSSNPASFLHPIGASEWLAFARQVPRNGTKFQQRLLQLDAAISEVTTGNDSSSVCTVDAIANWISSWKQHPYTVQLTESLWVQGDDSTPYPMAYFVNATEIVRSFPLSQASDVSAGMRSPQTLETLADIVAPTLLGERESLAIANLTFGFPLWRTFLESMCVNYDKSTGACITENITTGNDDALLAFVAQELLQRRFPALRMASQGAKTSIQSLKTILKSFVIPWLRSMPDSKILHAFILRHLAEDIEMTALPLRQFTNASVTAINYTIAIPVPSEYEEHLGIVSERIARSRLTFNLSSLSVIEVNDTSTTSGFGELAAFCQWSKHDEVFAYDAYESCTLGHDDTLSVASATRLLSAFGDSSPVNISNNTLETTAGAVLVDIFLGQPFASVDACRLAMVTVAQALQLTVAVSQAACQATADGVLLNLPVLSAMDLSPSSYQRIKAIQAYLKYTATKFTFEPHVVGLVPPVLTMRAIRDGPNTDSTRRDSVPLGGYLAAQTVGQALSCHHAESCLWQTTSSTETPKLTLSTPRSNTDMSMLSRKDQSVGQIVAVNDEAMVSMWGERFRISDMHATDGSQFTTAIFSARQFAARKEDFPPPKLLFHWEYPHRIAQAVFARNVTRFGIPLMRYTIKSWQQPSGIPDGLQLTLPQLRAKSNAPIEAVNISASMSDLPMLLSTAPNASESLRTNNRQEQSREIAVDVEPLTGQVYHRRLVWQLSSWLSQDRLRRDVWHVNLTEAWLPVLWVREVHSVSPTDAATFVSTAVTPSPFAKEKLALWGVVGGVVYLALGTVVTYFYGRRARTMMRIRKGQAVMPAGIGSTTLVADGTKIDPEASASVDGNWSADSSFESISKHLHGTSGVSTSSSGGSRKLSASARPRKRSLPPSIHTIEEKGEAVDDIGEDVQRL
ncbi:hypothetical protein PINS_up009486 [Pythium insidiosum]|nr:hypothetical protein PINS_up009486 [Pythium insidiosum]